MIDSVASHRWVCGALGSPDRAEYERLRTAVGAQPRPVVDQSGVVLHARGSLDAWSSPTAHGWTWGPPGATPPTGRRREAIASDTGAGVTIDSDGISLHVDASGVVPVFVYESSRYLLFSSSVDALARSVAAPLHVNWSTWSQILATMVALGGQTLFSEISRMTPSTAWHLQDDALRHEELSWPWVEETSGPHATHDAAVRNLVDALTLAVTEIGADRHIIPLSGGWDSRALAMVAARSDLRAETVTLPDEFGRDGEVVWAGDVARKLSLPHEVTADCDWTSGSEAMTPLVDYLTPLHYWMAPLLPWLESRRGVVLDGLAGDVLLKYTYVPEEDFDDPDADPLVGILRRYSTERAPSELLTPGLADLTWSKAAATLRSEWARWSDHPNSRNLTVYRTRTLGGIALAPMMALATVSEVATPFTHPATVREALRILPHHRRHQALYPQVLRALNRSVAQLPSTGTMRATPFLRRRPDQTSSSLREFTRLLTRPGVRELLGPELRGRVAAGRLYGVTDTSAGRRVVHGLALLSRWLDRYRNVLVDEPPFPGLVVGWRSDESRHADQEKAPRLEASPDPARFDEDWLLPQSMGSGLLLQRPTTTTDDWSVVTDLIEDEPAQPRRLADARGLSSKVRPPDTLVLDGVLTDVGRSESLIQTLTAWLPRGTRVICSMPFSPPSSPAESVVRRVELLGRHLEVISASISSRAVRLVGSFVPDGTGQLDSHVTTALYASIAEALEDRHERERDQIASLRREARRTARQLDKAHQDISKATATTRRLTDELNAAERARDKLEATLARARARRLWRAMDVVSRVRREPRRVFLLPFDLIRALARRPKE